MVLCSIGLSEKPRACLIRRRGSRKSEAKASKCNWAPCKYFVSLWSSEIPLRMGNLIFGICEAEEQGQFELEIGAPTGNVVAEQKGQFP